MTVMLSLSTILVCLCSTSLSAESAVWTKLDNAGDAATKRKSFGMVELAEGTFVVFGGNDLTNFTNNTQKLEVSGTTSTWTELYNSIGADAPTARDQHTMTYFVDGLAVVFGGYDGTFQNDVWEVEASGIYVVWNQLTNVGATPSVRAGHTMTAFSENTGVMFGGRNDDGYLNDVYQLQRSDNTSHWTQLTDSGSPPSRRSTHAMTELADGTLVIFGGYDGLNYLNDIYQLEISGTTAVWTQFTSTGDIPSERKLGRVELAEGTFVVFGGNDLRSFPGIGHTHTHTP